MANETEMKRAQVTGQYRVVAHLAAALAQVHGDLAPAIEAGACDEILDIQGRRSAHLMEALGDMLNGMDAVTREDEWTAAVFAEAHRMFPTTKATA